MLSPLSTSFPLSGGYQNPHEKHASYTSKKDQGALHPQLAPTAPYVAASASIAFFAASPIATVTELGPITSSASKAISISREPSEAAWRLDLCYMGKDPASSGGNKIIVYHDLFDQFQNDLVIDLNIFDGKRLRK